MVVYFDEVGNTNLAATDKDFPVFAVVMFICDDDVYANGIAPLVTKLKFKWFGHEGVILHSRDIRKAQGDFGILTDPARRKEFLDDISELMTACAYKLIAVAVRKDRHVAKYKYPADPYELSLLFAMERLVSVLEEAHQKAVVVIAEQRGKNEDRELFTAFQDIIQRGTAYVSRERFQKIKWTLKFLPKSMNIVGTQLADLAAYPIARRALDKTKPNPAFDIVRKKFCRMFKIFP